MCEKTERKRVAAERMAIDMRKQLNQAAASPKQTQDSGPDDAAKRLQYLSSQLQAQEQLVQEAQQMKARYRSGAHLREISNNLLLTCT